MNIITLQVLSQKNRQENIDFEKKYFAVQTFLEFINFENIKKSKTCYILLY